MATIAENGGSSILTIRVIKSFPYRTSKNLILRKISLEATSVQELKERALSEIRQQPGWKAYQTVVLDCMKIYSQPQGTKTSNLIINLEDDEKLILQNDIESLESHGCVHETEISFFNLDAYVAYKQNPDMLW